MTGPYTIQFKRDSSSRFYNLNPQLKQGEPAYETDTGRVKVGDGSSLWRDLEYFGGEGGGGDPDALLEHINSLLPHPVYDDGPSLTLIYENAKV